MNWPGFLISEKDIGIGLVAKIYNQNHVIKSSDVKTILMNILMIGILNDIKQQNSLQRFDLLVINTIQENLEKFK